MATGINKYYEERDHYLEKYKDVDDNIFSDQGYYTLMRNLIVDIYVYGSLGKAIEEFERKYGSNEEEYYEKEMKEYDAKNIPKAGIPPKNEIYEKWRNLARDNDYFAMLIAGSFIDEVEKILLQIQKYSTDIYSSRSLEKLVNNSYTAQIDKDNERLLSLYNRELKRDLIRYRRKCLAQIDKMIMALRNTSYYKLKNGIGDKVHIGNKLSITFGELYQKIYQLAESKIVRDVKYLTEKEEKSHVENIGYADRMRKISNSVEKIDSDNEYKKLYLDPPATEYTPKEESKLREIRKNIQKNVDALKEAYERLRNAYDNRQLTVDCIDGLKMRINAINDTVKALKGIVGYDVVHTGQISILTGTLKMLRDAKTHTAKELDKYRKTDELLGETLDEVETIIDMINNLESEFDLVIRGVKVRVQGKNNTENDNKTGLNM